jgi:outer membrane protein
MRSVLNQVKMEVHDALAALTAAQDQVEIAQAGLQMATKELDLARERYAVITAAAFADKGAIDQPQYSSAFLA